jgi:(1->4)-alpha-D-glucan 1-alpha-D-glucosylmutase
VLVVVAGRLFVDLSRRGADEGAIPALPEATRWKGATVCLPAGVRSVMLENLLTGESLSVGEGAIRLDDALRWMPWAVFSGTAPREK